MDINNPLYKNQGIHTNVVLLTADDGVLKVLLIKRTNNPFNGNWALPGGAVYNNETVEQAIKRELYEKTAITNIEPKLFNVFSKIDRAPDLRMICIGYISVIDKSAITFITKTQKTDDAKWFTLDEIPKNLAYDHNFIIDDALVYLKDKIWNSNILKTLFPKGVTMPELHNVYCKILGLNLDRRNFRKKMLLDGILQDTNEYKKTQGKKPAKIYKIN